MDSRQSSLPVDPAFLPPGTLVGPWRVRGWGGRGAYGTVYRVEREGDAAAGSFALKLAHCSRDERASREVELLSRIRHPSVPRLFDQGLWHHRSGDFPYLVMEWIEGTPLYDWAERYAPSWREMARMLAAVARALEATHAAAAVHRDVSRIMHLILHVGLRIPGAAGPKPPSFGGVQSPDGFAIELEPADVPASAALHWFKPPSLHPITHDGLGNAEALGDAVDGIEAVRTPGRLLRSTGWQVHAA